MTPTEMTAEELAPRTEDEVRAHLAAGKLVEGLQHMSPEYLKGIRRILTVSADTELVSAPAYLRAAAARAGAEQLRLGGLDHPGRARPRAHRLPAARRPRRRHAGADLRARAGGLQVPVRVRRAAGLLARAGAGQRALRPGRVRAALRRAPARRTFGPWKRALAKVDKEETFHLRHGRTWVKKLCRRPGREAQAAGRRWTGCSSSRSSGSGCRTRGSATASSSSTASRAGPTTSCARTGWAHVVPFMDEVGLEVPAHFDEEAER